MVTDEQWRAVATELELSPEALKETIAKLDRTRAAMGNVCRGMYFDRQGDELTLGEWGTLFGARSYRFLAETVLPNRRWIATIWSGVDPDIFRRPPVVLETTVFRLLPDGGHETEVCLEHQTEAEAFAAHRDLVRGLCV